MTPVSIIAIPHNGRNALYEGDLDEEGQPFLVHGLAPCLTLPIAMPASVLVTYSKTPDDILAIHVLGENGGRIRREDVQQVWRGIQQFNRDCATRNADEF